ncbi:hypothetical protein ACFZAU_24830 [Streptomyces sp. NPDC008238]
MSESAGLWRIRVLGPLALTKDGVPVAAPGPLPSAVLTALAVAGHRGLHVGELLGSVTTRRGEQAMRRRNTLERHISDLRQLGVPIPKYGSLVTDGYALPDDVAVDAWEFAAGVANLPAEPTERGIADLLALWTGDPRAVHDRVAPRRWDRLFRVRDQLLRLVEGNGTATSPELADFVALFPSDRACAALRNRLEQQARKRLLVVEDQNLSLVVSALDGYDCLPVAGRDAWYELVNSRREDLLRLDGALIDLHLTDGYRDEQGLDIAEWLADHTTTPAALMTMAPPAGDLVEGTQVQRARYRLTQIIYKGRDGLDVTGIRNAARVLTSDEDRHVRARLHTSVAWARFHAQERLATPPTDRTRRRLQECEREAEAALREVRTGELWQARTAVREFVDRWQHRQGSSTLR